MDMLNGPYFPEVFDSSILATFKSCPQLFKKVYLDQWKGKLPNVHLRAGGAFARGLEIARRSFYEQGQDSDTAIAAGLGALLEFYGDFECPADSAKSAERTAGALEYYFSQYAMDRDEGQPIIMPNGKYAIEFSFAHPLPINHPITGNPLICCGRSDAAIHYGGGKHILDDKTTSQLGASWSKQWDLRSQFTCYKWGFEQAGIDIDGVIVRGVSILKQKYDTQQCVSFRPDWQVDRWYNQLLETLEDIIELWKKGRWHYNLDSACADYGGCGFRLACSSKDELPFLETSFERRHWDPVTRVETLIA